MIRQVVEPSYLPWLLLFLGLCLIANNDAATAAFCTAPRTASCYSLALCKNICSASTNAEQWL